MDSAIKALLNPTVLVLVPAERYELAASSRLPLPLRRRRQAPQRAWRQVGRIAPQRCLSPCWLEAAQVLDMEDVFCKRLGRAWRNRSSSAEMWVSDCMASGGCAVQ